jgi:hypothetical protein
MKMLSTRYSKCIWIASPYHMDYFLTSLGELHQSNPDIFNSLDCCPTIICDIKHGNDMHITRFSPPFKSRVINLVNPRGSSEYDISEKIINIAKSLAEEA